MEYTLTNKNIILRNRTIVIDDTTRLKRRVIEIKKLLYKIEKSKKRSIKLLLAKKMFDYLIVNCDKNFRISNFLKVVYNKLNELSLDSGWGPELSKYYINSIFPKNPIFEYVLLRTKLNQQQYYKKKTTSEKDCIINRLCYYSPDLVFRLVMDFIGPFMLSHF